jgi:glutamate racemase
LSELSHRSIGIFDSGIGGLTVFREISKILPREDLVYLGDTARVPYGTKSAATVTRYAIQNVRFLLKEDVKLIVVACNTASAFAVEALQKEFSIPILGVIEPGVAGALRIGGAASPDTPKPPSGSFELAKPDSHSRQLKICVIGTEGTIASEAYTKALHRRDPSVRVSGVACPLFVPLVEEGWWENEITQQIARHYLNETLDRGLDAMILGCTHYPLLKSTLRKVVGERVALVDSAEETARETALLLDKRGLLRESSARPTHRFFVTDSPERFQRVGSMLLGETLLNVRHVEI